MRSITPSPAATGADARLDGADIPRQPEQRNERAEWVVALYVGGASLDEVAHLLNADREWVRERVAEAGLTCRRADRQVDALAILREVRRPGTLSLSEVAARLDYSEDTVRQSIAALGMGESVRRLMRLRRRTAGREAVANSTGELASVAVHAIDPRRSRVVRVA